MGDKPQRAAMFAAQGLTYSATSPGKRSDVLTPTNPMEAAAHLNRIHDQAARSEEARRRGRARLDPQLEAQIMLRLGSIYTTQFSGYFAGTPEEAKGKMTAYRAELSLALGRFGKDVIGRAIERCRTHYRERPPTIGQLEIMCVEAERHLRQVDKPKALPKSWNPAIGKAAIKQARTFMAGGSLWSADELLRKLDEVVAARQQPNTKNGE